MCINTLHIGYSDDDDDDDDDNNNNNNNNKLNDQSVEDDVTITQEELNT
jgi:hypothetical protein